MVADSQQERMEDGRYTGPRSLRERHLCGLQQGMRRPPPPLDGAPISYGTTSLLKFHVALRDMVIEAALLSHGA